MSSENSSINSNVSNFEDGKQTSSSPIHSILCAIVIFITIVGIVANILVVYIFIRIYKHNRITINILIISTALCDASMIAVTGPLHAASYIHGYWHLGHAGCQFYGFWVHFTSVSSLSNLVVIAIERFLVIKNNVFKDTKTFSTQVFLTIGALLYGLLWSSLPLLGWSSYTLEGLNTGCAPNWVSRDLNDVSYNIVLMLTEFCLPLGVIVYAYIKMVQLMRHHSRVLSKMEANLNNIIRRNSAIKLTIRLIAFMVGAFVISWLPYSLFCLFAIIMGPQNFPPVAASVPAIFAKSSVMWNPFIYAMKHTTFKTSLSAILETFRTRVGLFMKVQEFPVRKAVAIPSPQAVTIQ